MVDFKKLKEAKDKAPSMGTNEYLASLKGRYKLGRKVTTPLISLTYNNDMAFQVEGEMVEQPVDPEKPGKFKKGMTVMPVIDLSTGESVTLICNTVLMSAMRRVPEGYVGKKFLVHQGAKNAKGYFETDVTELEDG